jgi:acetyl esterase/lipase
MPTRQGVLFAVHDGVPLYGDFFAPEGPGPHPVLVAASGGGWLRGDRTQLAHWGQRLAASGVAVFSADYRRSTDGAIFPQNAQDVLAAGRFVDMNAGDLGVDRERMGLLGASAGGHLAALVALAGAGHVLANGYLEDAHADRRPRFRVLVGIYGVYDLPAHWRACQTQDPQTRDDLVERMLGGGYPENGALYDLASPVSHVASADPELHALLIHGDADHTVLPEQSERLAGALRGAGHPVQTIVAPGAGHFWFSRETDTQAGTNGLIGQPLIAFLRERFDLAPA